MVYIVVALGGNAILHAGERPTFSTQMGHVQETARSLVELLDDHDAILVTHGNGPQVGDILLQNELAKGEVPAMPLDACVAESEGLIGYMLQMALLNELRRSGREADILCCLTMVEVDEIDVPPSKPIGPYYQMEEMETLRKEKGWTFLKDEARGGYRRLVPSPRPSRLVGLAPLLSMLRARRDRPLIIIAGGGGGIPIMCAGHKFIGKEVVVDKDLTSSLLACSTGADTLIMLTDIGAVYIDYGKASQRPLGTVQTDEMERLLADGQFPTGSMGPKVQAAIDFVRGCGNKAIITDTASLKAALKGKAGTTVVYERR